MSIKPPMPKVVFTATRIKSPPALPMCPRKMLLPMLFTSRRLLKKLPTAVRTGLGVTLR